MKQKMRVLHEKGVAIRSAPSHAGVTREGAAEALTGDKRGGYSAPKRCNPDADAVAMCGRQHEQER